MNHRETASLFLQASRDYPTSVVAQGAYMADQFLTREIDTAFSIYLLANTYGDIPNRLILGLVRLAIKEHENLGFSAVKVDDLKMRSIIMSVSIFAQQYMNYRLTHEKLSLIMGLHTYHHRNRRSDINENGYIQDINKRLQINIYPPENRY